MQGLLQMAGIPYVGAQVSASAVAMDKTLTKLVMDNAGITQAEWLLVRSSALRENMNQIIKDVEEKFSYPVFVKPSATGSSIGVSKVRTPDALQKAIENAAAFDEVVLVEEFIDGREIEVAVMGNESPVASVCGEIDPGSDFYDYETK